MSDADDSGPGRREVAYRLFAAEFDDAEFDYSESDEERAPNYVVTPTGARANRLFAVGVLTEVESVNPEMDRGRVVDPTGAFVTYAGQYQPEALAVLERTEPPAFVALSGKARTFEPDDDDVVYSSVRPESVSAVDAETRDRWVVTAAERTLDRVGVAAAALESGLTDDALRAALTDAGVDDRLADGVALALEYYDTTPAYLGALREAALDAARVVAGEADEADAPALAPDDPGGPDAPTAADLATMELSAPATASDAGDTAATAEPDPEPEPVEATAGAGTDVESTTSTPGDDTAETEPTATTADTGADSGVGADTDTEAGADADVDADAAVDSDGETDTEADVETEVGDLEAATADVEEPGEFEPGEFDLDEETRQEVEEEYGTEFSTADEVEEADIETPEPDAEAEADEPAGDDDDDGADADAEDDEPAADAEADEPEPDPEETADEDEAEADAGDDEDEDVDLEDAVMAAMETVGDGDGADREALVAAVVDEHGVDPEAVEEAIQDALMSGRCYEPADGTLKAI
ncbi:hypothetical protein BRD02_05050 [Halobacteriales archaeon QS_8_69_73]|nr:MAG: hypothetical protein BRD02_05050 [Halobacteriales archaeon QS_8_69_73]